MKRRTTLFIVIFSIFIITTGFLLKPLVVNHIAKRKLQKIINSEWESLFFGFQNRSFLPYNEGKKELKFFIFNSFTFDIPKKNFPNIYKAKIICSNGSIIYFWFSPYAWCFSDAQGKKSKLYRVNDFSQKYYQKLFLITQDEISKDE
jgi:hypothetical protein